MSHPVRPPEQSESRVASMPLANSSVLLSTPPRQRQWSRYRHVEKVEPVATCGDASLVYAGYPYDPFALDKPTH